MGVVFSIQLSDFRKSRRKRKHPQITQIFYEDIYEKKRKKVGLDSRLRGNDEGLICGDGWLLFS